MLKEQNAEQHLKNLDYLETQELRDTYCYMLGHAACLPNYQCYPNIPINEKHKRYFQYHNSDGQPFAFIINKHSILFYFRKPCAKWFDSNAVTNAFPEANVKDNGEITVRIAGVARAREVVDFAFGIIPK
jgi:hypothetical protein